MSTADSDRIISLEKRIKALEDRLTTLLPELSSLRDSTDRRLSALEGDVGKCVKADTYYKVQANDLSSFLGVIVGSGEFWDVRMVPDGGPHIRWKFAKAS